MQSPPPGWIPNPPYSKNTLKRKSAVSVQVLLILIAVGLLLGIVFTVSGLSFFRSFIGNNGAGNPHIGDPYSDFVAKYGSPQNNFGSAKFYGDSSHTILIDTGCCVESMTQNSQVIGLDISGPNTWTSNQTVTYCKQFLPNDATVTRSIFSNVENYHSSVGSIALMPVGIGGCSLWIEE